MNLRKIEGDQHCLKLLLQLVRLYRRGLGADRNGSLQQMIVMFPGHGAADENWMSLFMRAERPESRSLQDVVQQQFDWLDVILEGCHKYYLRTFYVFAVYDHSGNFPAGIESRDYGALIAGLPKAFRTRFKVLCEDPERGIAVNQWRNIAAHKTFTLRSSRTLDVSYGRPPKQKTVRITTASLRRTLEWAVKALNTLRLASVIVYLEYMQELSSLGLPETALRLDSSLTHLYHNFRLVGFAALSQLMEQGMLTVDLLDCQDRSVRDAIIHASQFLSQLSGAVSRDPTVRRSVKRTRVRLLDTEGQIEAEAAVDVSRAIAHAEGQLSLKEYIGYVDFTMGDWSTAQQETGADA